MFQFIRAAMPAGTRQGVSMVFRQSGRRSSSQPEPKRSSWRPFVMALIGGSCGLIIGRPMYDEWRNRKIKAKVLSTGTKVHGKPDVGGPFSLTDHHGQPVTEATYLGKWILIYFGFVHCPDVCPEELEKIAESLNLLEKAHGREFTEKVVPLFITIDPERDDVKAVAGYVKEFHPKLVGLTGTTEQVKAAAKSYRVYFVEGPRDAGGDYILDHTIVSYLVSPSGKFATYFSKQKNSQDIVDGIVEEMSKFDAENSEKHASL